MRWARTLGSLGMLAACSEAPDTDSVRTIDTTEHDPEGPPDAADTPAGADAARPPCEGVGIEEDWHHEQVESYAWAMSSVRTFAVGMGVHPDGDPHVGYVPFNGNCCWAAYHATRRDGAWIVEESGVPNGASASRPRIAFDANGDVWMGYGSRGGWIAVEHQGDWTVHGVPGVPDAPALGSQAPAFASGPDGDLHWFYGVTGAIAHATGDVAAPTIELIATLRDLEYGIIVSAVHDGQSLHVVYGSNLRGGTYLTRSGTLWHEVEAPVPTTFLATDDAGRVHFLGNQGSELLYAYPVNGEYMTEVVLASTDLVLASLSIDPAGIARVGVIDGGALQLASRIDGAWEIEIVSDFVRGAALTVDSSGRAHAFYGGREASVIYATRRVVMDPDCG